MKKRTMLAGVTGAALVLGCAAPQESAPLPPEPLGRSASPLPATPQTANSRTPAVPVCQPVVEEYGNLFALPLTDTPPKTLPAESRVIFREARDTALRVRKTGRSIVATAQIFLPPEQFEQEMLATAPVTDGRKTAAAIGNLLRQSIREAGVPLPDVDDPGYIAPYGDLQQHDKEPLSDDYRWIRIRVDAINDCQIANSP